MSKETDPAIFEKAKKIKLVLLDVDGVLTDGRLYMGSGGEEMRAFHVLDGLGIRLGQRGGLLFGLISGRESKVISDRAADLYITEVHQGIFNKVEKYEEIVKRMKLEDDQVCFIGDDLIDLPIMRRVGLAAAPCDAAPEVLQASDMVCTRPGGRGAVREVSDLLLKARGQWDSVTARFFKE